MKKLLMIVLSTTFITSCATGWVGNGNTRLPIRGQVIDQYGKPVSGVKVKYQYGYNKPVLLVLPGIYPNVKSGEFTTDKDGRFDLGMFSISSLVFMDVSKTGYFYRFQDNDYPRQYKQNNKPLIIRLWKITGVARELRRKFVSIRSLKADRSVYGIDFIRGETGKNITSHADMKFSIEQPEKDNPCTHWQWDVTIKVPGGGLIESNAMYMFEAPDTGYQSVWHASSDCHKTLYRSTIKKKFYFKLDSGKAYGKMQLEISPVYLKPKIFEVRLEYIMNPNGSKFLIRQGESSYSTYLLN